MRVKENSLVIGIVLIIIGVALFIIGYNGVSEYQTFLGQLARAFSEEARREYLMYQIMEIIGGVLAFLGMIVSLRSMREL